MQSICGFVHQSSVLKTSLLIEEGNKEDCSWLEVVAEYRPQAPASDLPLCKRMDGAPEAGCVLQSVAEEESVPVPQVFKVHLDDAGEEGTHLMENCMR